MYVTKHPTYAQTWPLSLADKQANISQHFARGAPKDKLSQFAGISHNLDPITGLPVLHGALGVVFCNKRETVTMGDHLVWFGDVSGVHEVCTPMCVGFS